MRNLLVRECTLDGTTSVIAEIHGLDCSHTNNRMLNFVEMEYSSLANIKLINSEELSQGWKIVVFPCSGLCSEKTILKKGK